jgi:hypothetical protein
MRQMFENMHALAHQAQSDVDLADFGVGKREAAPEDFPPSKAARHGDQEEGQGAEALVDDIASAEHKRFQGQVLKAAHDQPVGAICILPILLALSRKFWTLEKSMMKFGEMMWLTTSNQVTW